MQKRTGEWRQQAAAETNPGFHLWVKNFERTEIFLFLQNKNNFERTKIFRAPQATETNCPRNAEVESKRKNADGRRRKRREKRKNKMEQGNADGRMGGASKPRLRLTLD